MDQMNGFQISSKRLKVQHNRVHHNVYLAGGGGGDYGEVGGGQGVSVSLTPFLLRITVRRQAGTGAKGGE